MTVPRERPENHMKSILSLKELNQKECVGKKRDRQGIGTIRVTIIRSDADYLSSRRSDLLSQNPPLIKTQN